MGRLHGVALPNIRHVYISSWSNIRSAIVAKSDLKGTDRQHTGHMGQYF